MARREIVGEDRREQTLAWLEHPVVDLVFAPDFEVASELLCLSSPLDPPLPLGGGSSGGDPARLRGKQVEAAPQPLRLGCPSACAAQCECLCPAVRQT